MKTVLLILALLAVSGCSNVPPKVTQMETKDFKCVVYDNDLEENLMQCFKK